MPASEAGEWVVLGRVSGIYGVRGMVKVFSFTESRDSILDYSPWYLGPDRRPWVLEDGRMQGEGVVAKLAQVEDREQARALIGQEIAVIRADLPELGAGEFYWSTLTGLRVLNREGIVLGTVSAFLETGANDVMVIDDGKGGELLIPWSAEASAGVDLPAGQIVVDWQADW
ncbi:ribosome maturation factor RimM [Acidithiobacillus ferrooxidans]|uniref:Ribosome maturation factor RimM n=1 Tax=Acidithiobacillus ferrooxidans TaxID=920 RepID=A0A2W1K3F6_ACIFR|nr:MULTISPECIES: ribosome maturation factor RimM [Acidithiobacillus]MBN6747126.1 ribosome maturation factor RimM [Acidithiobacillus sp. PG05]MBN6745330.1 ribosome maturation factor RimM [Acidithiobacillus sp. MC2.2]MBU2773857.1 ribosome maturation factor RimM [Acidithiobacillus ferrooxidans]MBU2806738.1 ribosome maturation factor RimM [Acidithiobacillus ferrooxidans F221]MBU2823226.1 ribosome maturation factor RimM [Acidithiobacillus ferrooxidans]